MTITLSENQVVELADRLLSQLREYGYYSFIPKHEPDCRDYVEDEADVYAVFTLLCDCSHRQRNIETLERQDDIAAMIRDCVSIKNTKKNHATVS